jgi:hypothetical protein
MMRVEHEYQRGGALAWPPGMSTGHGVRPLRATGIALFARLVEQVMSIEPYASADRVFWVVDNGSSHHPADPAAPLPPASNKQGGAGPTKTLYTLKVSWVLAGPALSRSALSRREQCPED